MKKPREINCKFKQHQQAFVFLCMYMFSDWYGKHFWMWIEYVKLYRMATSQSQQQKWLFHRWNQTSAILLRCHCSTFRREWCKNRNKKKRWFAEWEVRVHANTIKLNHYHYFNYTMCWILLSAIHKIRWLVPDVYVGVGSKRYKMDYIIMKLKAATMINASH